MWGEDRTRTCDLLVMSQASYQLLYLATLKNYHSTSRFPIQMYIEISKKQISVSKIAIFCSVGQYQ
jgi:hypothetical protein